MKINRSILILSGGLLLGLLGGVTIQKLFPVGQTIKKIQRLVGIEDQPDLENAFVPVSPPPEDSVRLLAAQMTISAKPDAVAKRCSKLKIKLQSDLPLEIAFRKSETSIAVLNELRNARRDGTIAEIEFLHERIFKETEVINFEDFEALTETLQDSADRIAEFSRLLAKDGTHLIYAPAPNPVDTFFPVLAGQKGYRSITPLRTLFLLKLLENNVDVVDLRPDFGEMALSGRLPYHRFDHHWTPAGNEFAATILSREIGERFEISTPFRSSGAPEISYRWIPIPASDWNLSLAPPSTDPGTLFGREVLLGEASIRSVPSSPLWVMGDSMLLEASPVRSGIAADVGSHLAGQLQAPVNSLGRPGTSDIRTAYFLNSTLSDSKPKVLVWVHADDEFLDLPVIRPASLTAARQAISATVKVLEVSPLPDPSDTPYPDAIFSFRVELQLPRNQTVTAIIYSWGFQQRKLSALAEIAIGEERSVTLQPWLEAVKSNESLGTARVIDQLDNFEGDAVFWLGPDS